MMRRRMMLQSGGAEKAWDYEWDYSMGLLEDNGWTKTTSGTATSSMSENGQKLTSAMNSYVRFENPHFSTMDVGVLEVRLSAKYLDGSGTQNFRISLSNGSNGVQVYANRATVSGSTGRGLKLLDNAIIHKGTLLAPFESGSEHTIRVELNHTTGAVYMDGTLLNANVNVSSMLYCSATRIWSQNQVGNDSETIIKSVKIRKGRL